MSKLSTFFHKAADFVIGAVAHAPDAQHAQLTAAADQFSNAAKAAESALPVLAKVVIDAALANVGGGTYIPAFNEFLDALIAELASRKAPA